MKTIYLIKHSGPFVEIKNYLDYENFSWKDYNRNMILSVEGENKAKKLCDIDELNNIDRLFASDSSRAIASAKYLAEKNNIKIELDDRINERIFGIEKLSELPKNYNNLSFDDKDFKIKGGESLKEVDNRFKNFISCLLNEDDKKYVLVIHGLMLLSYLQNFCEFEFVNDKFKIKFKGKVILDGVPESPSIYKIVYNKNNEVMDVDIIKI